MSYSTQLEKTLNYPVVIARASENNIPHGKQPKRDAPVNNHLYAEEYVLGYFSYGLP